MRQNHDSVGGGFKWSLKKDKESGGKSLNTLKFYRLERIEVGGEREREWDILIFFLSSSKK